MAPTKRSQVDHDLSNKTYLRPYLRTLFVRYGSRPCAIFKFKNKINTRYLIAVQSFYNCCYIIRPIKKLIYHL